MRDILRFTESDDGEPDEDMPALVRTQEMGQFKGTSMFALCKDPKFKEEEVAALRTKTYRVSTEYTLDHIGNSIGILYIILA
jgi:hypothetical protein